jgi:CheY-like chemotaxis protein
MNLDLGILWIEDSFSPEEEQALRRRVQDAGFVARIATIPNGNGIDEIARKHQLYHLYDVILLDYRLQDEKGDELAPKVRELFPSTTILFYSGSAEEQKLRSLIADKAVEGVYCCSRVRFTKRAGELIDQTARSLDRLSGMRGLAMRVVAECDDLMKVAMLSMCARDAKCADKVADLDNDVLKFLDGAKQAYEASQSKDLIARIETRAVDSMKLFKHFRRLTEIAAANPSSFGLDDAAADRLRELRKSSARYDQMVLRKRNLLGHVVEVEGNTGVDLTR